MKKRTLGSPLGIMDFTVFISPNPHNNLVRKVSQSSFYRLKKKKKNKTKQFRMVH